MSKKLSEAQYKVLLQMKNGSVIGEQSEKFNGRYELFTRKPYWIPETNNPCEHSFTVRTINRNTIFALLTLGLIHKDNNVGETMLPFSRDVWYVFERQG